MDYRYNFDEICSQVPFTALLTNLKIPFTQEGKTIKTADAIITTNACKKGNLTFDLWKAKGSKDGGSVLDYVQIILGLKTKLEAAQWLKENILGEQEQNEEPPELQLEYHEYLASIGISEAKAKDYQVGYCKKGVMSGRIAFKLIDHEGKHRGYIGYDHTGKKTVRWFIVKGVNTSDFLYNYYRKNGTNYCIITDNPLNCLYLCSIGFSYTIAMLTKTIIPAQKELLKCFKYVLAISENPAIVATCLCNQSFVKTIPINPIGKTHDEIKTMF